MSGARDWLKEHQTATVQDLSNDMWVRIERTNRMLEQYGRGDFVENMPVLFAMYYCTAVTVMQIPEEPTGMELQKLYLENVRNLENECLIDEKESAHMVDAFHEACRSIAQERVGMAEQSEEKPNPFTPIIRAGARCLGLPYRDIHLELIQFLTDFAISYRIQGTGATPPFRS